MVVCWRLSQRRRHIFDLAPQQAAITQQGEKAPSGRGLTSSPVWACHRKTPIRRAVYRWGPVRTVQASCAFAVTGFPRGRARHDLRHFRYPCGRAGQNVHECGKVFGVQMDGGVLHQHETNLPEYTPSLTPGRHGQNRKRMQDRGENLCLSRLPDMNRSANATVDMLNYKNLTAGQRPSSGVSGQVLAYTDMLGTRR